MLEQHYLTPIFGARKVAVNAKNLEANKGADQLWFLLNENNEVMTSDSYPSILNVELGLDGTHLTIAFPGMFFRLAFANKPQRVMTIQAPQYLGDVGIEPDLYSQAISRYLGSSLKLVRKLS